METCSMCHKRKPYQKGLCNKCLRTSTPTRQKNKEKLGKRNYIENGVGVLTDTSGARKWIIDIEDFEKCSGEYWTYSGDNYAWTNKIGYLHKFLCPQLEKVDHIDRNQFNNRKYNLRDGSGINGINTIHPMGRSGFHGVWQNKKSGRWCAMIQYQNKRYYLGTYDNPELAHEAVIKFAHESNLIKKCNIWNR
jgi:hypothetical protein